MVVHDVEEIGGTQTPYGGGTMVVQRTPEEERCVLHSDSNGYTNLPDVVQPSHSPTESSKGQSPPSKDGGSDVSRCRQVHGVRREHWQWVGDSRGAQALRWLGRVPES